MVINTRSVSFTVILFSTSICENNDEKLFFNACYPPYIDEMVSSILTLLYIPADEALFR